MKKNFINLVKGFNLMKSIYLLFIFIFVFSLFSQIVFAKDRRTEKACMDNREIAEEKGFDCAEVGKTNRNDDGKSPLQEILDLRNKNKKTGENSNKKTTTTGTKNNTSGTKSTKASYQCRQYDNCWIINFDYSGSKGYAKRAKVINRGQENPQHTKTLNKLGKMDAFFRYYKVDAMCYTGTSSNRTFSMWYRHDGQGNQQFPTGKMQGEDCLPIDINTVEAKFVKGEWKVVDKNQWIFSFKNNEIAARDAECSIRNYNLTRVCWAGGGRSKSNQYMRK